MTVRFGKSLFIDKDPQSSESDHFIYNEALIHPALSIHPHPQRVFLAGVGPGSSLREILRHTIITDVIASDIDRPAVDLYKKHLYEWHRGSFDDPRVRLIIGDSRDLLEKADDHQFDCIFIDVCDPLAHSPSVRLFTREFYSMAKKKLRSGGMLVTQAGQVKLNDMRYHQSIYWTVSDVFRRTCSYSVYYPFYAEEWGFILASDEYEPADVNAVRIDANLAERGCKDLRFYSGATHTRLFVTPRCYRESIHTCRDISTDKNPLIVTQREN